MSIIKPLKIQKIKGLKLNSFEGNTSSKDGIEEVYKIELTTPLDMGSANEKEITKSQNGLLYGKTYEFKVTEYIGEKPKKASSIKWELSYYDNDTEDWEKLPIANTGEKVWLNMKNEETCGKNLYIRAYINDNKNDAVLKKWKHNKFRWFNSLKIRKEIEARKINPWKINQDDTNTCGPSAIMYVFAKNDPLGYEKFILDLHRKGFTKHNDYEINVNGNSNLEKIAGTDPIKSKNFPKDMAYSDWIPNICITDQENDVFDFEGNTKEDFSGITLPSRLTKLSEKLLGFADVVNNTNLYFNKDVNKTIEAIDELIKLKADGYEVFLFISVNMLDNKVTNSVTASAEHWVVLENINESEDSDFVEFKIYTYGQEPTKKYKISYEAFRTNYYGYVKAK